ncbi:MAG: tandem-95 repeat protein, partial [Magnetococcales bacterium]|nr:tandem-95 repeat protein [Magnetococcales bacterium]
MASRILITVTSADGTTRAIGQEDLVSMQPGDQVKILEWDPSMASQFPNAPVLNAEWDNISDMVNQVGNNLVLKLEGGKIVAFENFALYLKDGASLVAGPDDDPSIEIDSTDALQDFMAMKSEAEDLANIETAAGTEQDGGGPDDGGDGPQTRFSSGIGTGNTNSGGSQQRVSTEGDDEGDGEEANDNTGPAITTGSITPDAPPNQGPNATDDAVETFENDLIQIDVLGNDSDPDRDGLSVTSATLEAGLGSVAIVNNQIVFTPGDHYDALNVGDSATASISYTISDGQGGAATATVTVTVNGTNDGPVAVVDTAGDTENNTIDIDVLKNDTDVDQGAAFTVVEADVTTGNGSASVVDNLVQFDPGTDFDHLALDATEQVIITYTMQDEHGAASSSTATITVTGTNDGPVAVEDVGGVVENHTIRMDVLANDTDLDDGHSFTLDTINSVKGGGSAQIVDGELQFKAGKAFDHLNVDDEATVTITYTMSDEHGAESQATATIIVTGTNDGPHAKIDWNGRGEENDTITMDVLANDQDIDDGHSLTLDSLRHKGPGSVEIVDNKLEFTTGTDFDHLNVGDVKRLAVSYSMSDEHGAVSRSAAVITIRGTNDGPVAEADTASDTENSAISINVLANDTDVDDGAKLTLKTAEVTDGNGSASVGKGQVQFDPGTDFDHLAKGDTETVTVTYTIQDE